jgi:hypothetical protein
MTTSFEICAEKIGTLILDVVQLDYESDAPFPRKVDIRAFADGGVTVTIHSRPFRLQKLLAWCLLIGLVVGVPMLFGGHVSVQRLLRTAGYILAVPASVLIMFLVCGWRNNDATEVIAIGPKAVHVKPPNGWAITIARSDLKRIEIRKPYYDFEGWEIDGAIVLRFDKHTWLRVFEGGSEEETRAVAEALRKAIVATSLPKP